jgi:hypothetical protein
VSVFITVDGLCNLETEGCNSPSDSKHDVFSEFSLHLSEALSCAENMVSAIYFILRTTSLRLIPLGLNRYVIQ